MLFYFFFFLFISLGLKSNLYISASKPLWLLAPLCLFCPLSLTSWLPGLFSAPLRSPRLGTHTLCLSVNGLSTPTPLSTSYLISASMPLSQREHPSPLNPTPTIFCGPFFFSFGPFITTCNTDIYGDHLGLQQTCELHEGKMKLVFLAYVSLGTNPISEAEQRLSKYLLNE